MIKTISDYFIIIAKQILTYHYKKGCLKKTAVKFIHKRPLERETIVDYFYEENTNFSCYFYYLN